MVPSCTTGGYGFRARRGACHRAGQWPDPLAAPRNDARGSVMNGGQDLGGAHGHGPVRPEPNEPVFHAEWEKRAFALTLAMGAPGGWNIDMSRFASENRPPAEYLSMSYYQIWFAALETMLKQRGLVSDDEIAAGRSLRPPKPVKRV